ncbi:MAG TPA: thiamine phosphate synthase [Candidatus Dormibacteraeota bacterium]|nr:thiamine phosphate synthase [Candidatus Dormibacteraeota bacterium]
MFPPLYAIIDSTLSGDRAIVFVRALSGAGVTLFQLRHKTSTPAAICTETVSLLASIASPEVRLIINDRPDIAAITGAAGVHVGQYDLPVEAAREICGPARWVGVSTHNLDQLREADRTSADYIAVGPIFPTATKGNPDPVVGVEFVRAARRITRKPLVAIGGISADTAEQVYRAGADSVAVIRDLIAADDRAARARQYFAAAERARS